MVAQIMENLSSEIQTIAADHAQTMNRANQLLDTFERIFEEPPAVPRTRMRAEDWRSVFQDQPEPEPVRTSSLQQGYCFIGKINDTRHCAKVNERTQCMSGDIYPTKDICINPNLRA